MAAAVFYNGEDGRGPREKGVMQNLLDFLLIAFYT